MAGIEHRHTLDPVHRPDLPKNRWCQTHNPLSSRSQVLGLEQTYLRATPILTDTRYGEQLVQSEIGAIPCVS
jgi:hypothetical protein